MEDVYGVNRVTQTNRKFSQLIDNSIMDGMGEKAWNKLSLKRRREIIEDIFNDENIEEKFHLTKEERQEVLKKQWAQEG